MPLIRFGPETLHDRSQALNLEWLETNGLGGYASSTVLLANTRRYHGLLVAPLEEPRGRFVLLSGIDEVAVLGDQTYLLSTNLYENDVVHPSGYLHLTQFTKTLFPTFTLQIGPVELGREIFMVHGENTVVVVYTVKNLPPGEVLRLELHPLVSFRSFRDLSVENEMIYTHAQPLPGRVRVSPYFGMPPLDLYHGDAEIEPRGYWYRRFYYPREKEEGFPYIEDQYNHCQITYTFHEPGEAHLIATIEPWQEAPDLGRLRQKEVERRDRLAGSILDNAELRELRLSAEHFLVRRSGRPAVFAGYPWHGERGREAMIALPGLTLAREQPETARRLLESYLDISQNGLLPDHVKDEDEAEVYTSFDASLWLFEAIWRYVQQSGDLEFMRGPNYSKLARIIDHFIKGTEHKIRMDPSDMLLQGGSPELELTWMNAQAGGQAVTHRYGKPVEVQALWYNALRILERLSHALDPSGNEAWSYVQIAQEVKKSFNEKFWSVRQERLADRIGFDGKKDMSVRPNALFSFSLSFPVLEKSHATKVLKVVRDELWTPYGLRSLSPRDPKYRGRYEGNEEQRNRGYHQGTVWSWLIGPFYSAYFRVHGRNRETVEKAQSELAPLRAHLHEAGLGTVSAIFDGDAPHTPRGSIAEATSNAELLRIQLDYLSPRTTPLP